MSPSVKRVNRYLSEVARSLCCDAISTPARQFVLLRGLDSYYTARLQRF